MLRLGIVRRALRGFLVLVVLVISRAGSRAHAQHVVMRPSVDTMADVARQVAMDLVDRAQARERDGHLGDAEALYRRAIEADDGLLAGHLGWARMLVARRRTEEALGALARIPSRAFDHDRDAIDLARALYRFGSLDRALSLLTARRSSLEAQRVRSQIAAEAGRFPEALDAARRIAELTEGTDEARPSMTRVRALRMLVGSADAVRNPGPIAGPLRRLLAQP